MGRTTATTAELQGKVHVQLRRQDPPTLPRQPTVIRRRRDQDPRRRPLHKVWSPAGQALGPLRGGAARKQRQQPHLQVPAPGRRPRRSHLRHQRRRPRPHDARVRSPLPRFR